MQSYFQSKNNFLFWVFCTNANNSKTLIGERKINKLNRVKLSEEWHWGGGGEVKRKGRTFNAA
jgi:hypothetical protein